MTKENFTRREREIAELVAQDKTPKQIAQALTVEKRTVYWHMFKIATKLRLPDHRVKSIADALKSKKSAEQIKSQ